MPKYRITSPDGRTFEVTAPDGATQDEVLAYAQANFAPTPDISDPARSGPSDSRAGADTIGGAPDALTSAGQYASSGNRAILQSLGLPITSALDAVAYPFRKGYEAITGESVPSYTSTFDRGLSELGFQPGQTRGQRLFGDAVGGAAAGLTGVGIGQQLARSSGPVLSGVGRVLASAPETQALAGGSAGLASGSAREAGAGPVGQMAAGLLGGLAAPLAAPKQLGGIPFRNQISTSDPLTQGPDAYLPAAARGPTTEYQQAVQSLENAEIPLTAGQRRGVNWLKSTERTLSEVPWSGEPLQRVFEGQSKAYQRELLKRVGLDDGSDMITQQTLDKAGDNLSRKYAEALGDKRVSIADDAFLDSLATIEARHSAFVDDPAKARVRRIVGDFLDAADTNGGQVSGEWYQAQRSLFAKRAMKNSEVSDLYGDLKSALDDAFTRAAGNVKGSLDSQWARLKQLQGIYQRNGGPAISEGFVSPAAVARSAAGAPGGRDWQNFTRSAAAVLPDRMGNSGTAQRNLVLGLLSGGAAGALDPASLLYGPALMRGASGFLSTGTIPQPGGLLMPMRQSTYPALISASEQQAVNR